MLKVFDGLLTQIDEELPLGRHVFSLFQHLVPVEDLISVFLVRAQEVVVSDPESDVIVRSIVVVIAAFHTVCLLVGAVETFDELLEGTEFFGYFIVIRKTDDLCDVELKVFTVFMEELLGGQDIGTVSVCNDLLVFGFNNKIDLYDALIILFCKMTYSFRFTDLTRTFYYQWLSVLISFPFA